ncbi:MAG TPA: cytochrome c oxidase subunit II [Gammaproteobacteria bacterium]|nr:cytochrome c oxidase subunit II [Gammaproteobacteria bacterium]
MTNRTRVLSLALALFGLTMAGPAWCDLGLNMTPGVTAVSREIYGLHMLTLWVCVVIGVGVYGAMVYAIVKFRRSKHAEPAKFTHSYTVEVIWTVIPAIILIVMAIPAARTAIKMEDTRGSQLTVKVTGFQWRWQYDYIDDGVRYFSTLKRDSNAARKKGSGIDPNTIDHYLLDVDNPLVVPVNTKVRLLVTAADVIHSWWMPAFGVKKDGVPGFINETWFQADTEGTYRGQCAELCGMDHGFMPIVVRVTSREEYDAWLKSQRAQVSLNQ